MLTEKEILEANRTHDMAHHTVCMDPSVKVKSRWLSENAVTGRLTDKLIVRYQKAGFFSEEMKAARKKFRDGRAAKRRLKLSLVDPEPRSGNFTEIDGRLIYCPR